MPIDNKLELKASIINRAATDEAFRNELIKDPKNTIKKHIKTLDLDSEFSTDLDPKLNIHVHIETENDVHLVVTPIDKGLAY